MQAKHDNYVFYLTKAQQTILEDLFKQMQRELVHMTRDLKLHRLYFPPTLAEVGIF